MTGIIINNRKVGTGYRTYVIAEMSANHGHDFERAVRIVEAASKSGADAIKLQTYTPDTITVKSDNDCFRIKGTIWDGRTLYDLYKEAYTPWEWHPKLKAIAQDFGLEFFSTPFDPTAVDFLESLGVPAYKVASPEIVDIPLISRVASTGKPVIMSTGMATRNEIDAAVQTVLGAGNNQLALLKCTSAYPASPDEMHLRTIPHLAETFHVPVGLSDHTIGIEVPVAAVALGACIIEKHLILSRNDRSPDASFSLEPGEFGAMVTAVRNVEAAMGEVHYGPSEQEKIGLPYRRSLFVVQDIAEGEVLTLVNVRSIRPGQGLPPRYLDEIVGRRARRKLIKGTPLVWDMFE